MGDPSWEDCVNQVLIPGDPGAIDDAGFRWQNIFTALEDVKHTLDSEVLRMEGWSGPAADAYKTAVGSICQMIEQFNTDNSYINSKLFEASYDLQQAMVTMPIPQEMVPTILQKRHEFETQDSYWPVPQDEFLRSALARNETDPDLHFGPDSFGAWWHDFWHDNTDQAVRIYKTLDAQHGDTAATLPGGALTGGGLDSNLVTPDLTHGPGGGGGGVGGLGFGSHGPGTASLAGLGPDAGTDPFQGPDPTTGLSGVDGGGFTGADSGLDGLGGSGGLPGLGRATNLGGGGGLGAGGLSPASAAAAMKGVGTPVNAFAGAPAAMAPGMMGGMGGAGAKAPSTRRPGLVGAAGGPGATGRGADDAHGTWLQEDDDVWGSDNGAAPPLLT